MLIALPPSEGKTAPTTGPALDLDSLSIQPFTDLRHELVRELETVSAGDNALDVLGVGATVRGEVEDQQHLSSLPCAPAHEVYTGVLYQAAEFSSLSEEELARAGDSVLIFSGLFGATSPTDLIPRYRLKMGVKLPAGTPKARWRKLWHHLDERADGQLVIDARSSDYAGWSIPDSATHVKIGAVRETDGVRKVITHNAKYYRGLFTRLALTAQAVPTTADDLADLGSEQPKIDAIELSGTGRNLTLTVVDREQAA